MKYTSRAFRPGATMFGPALFLFAIIIIFKLISEAYQLPWRNWLARLTVNQEVGGSSPPGSDSFFSLILFL
jgi:hypothetical protein